MIEIKNLTKSFGKKNVLNNLNLTIESKKIFGLVGINGAGKSTLLRILSSVYYQDSGEVLFDGCPAKEVETKKNIFFLPDDPYIESHESVQSFFLYYQNFYEIDKNKFFEYLQLFKLDQAIESNLMQSNISKFSKGMKRQLFICLALAIAPKYLFLDEAFDGLDPLARLTFKRIISRRMEEKEMTIIISSHSLRELEDICDNFGLLDGGEVSNSGNIEDKKDEYQKYQLAFDKEVSRETFEGLFGKNLVSYNITGRIIILIIKNLQEDDVMSKLDSIHPLLIDRLSIDFEELFIIEVESKGYIKNEK